MRLFQAPSRHLFRQPLLCQPLSSRFALHGLRALENLCQFLSLFAREEKNGVLAKGGLCPLPKTGGFDENGDNDEWTLYPRKQGLCSSDP